MKRTIRIFKRERSKEKDVEVCTCGNGGFRRDEEQPPGLQRVCAKCDKPKFLGFEGGGDYIVVEDRAKA